LAPALSEGVLVVPARLSLEFVPFLLFFPSPRVGLRRRAAFFLLPRSGVAPLRCDALPLPVTQKLPADLDRPAAPFLDLDAAFLQQVLFNSLQSLFESPKPVKDTKRETAISSSTTFFGPGVSSKIPSAAPESKRHSHGFPSKRAYQESERSTGHSLLRPFPLQPLALVYARSTLTSLL